MKKQSTTELGFTLIELMITVAILAILSAIALPSYSEYVKKGKRTEAKVELLRIGQMQESYFVQNLSYAKDLSQLGFSANTIDSEGNLYKITMGSVLPNPCDPNGTTPIACTSYHVQATVDSSGSQQGDSACSGFRLDHIARKFAIGTGASNYGTTAAHIAKAKTCW